MIRGTAQVTHPEEVELTISITAKVREWRELVEQTDNRYPGWALAQIVTKTIGASVTRIESAHEEKP